MRYNAVKRFRVIRSSQREYTQFSSVDVKLDGLRIHLASLDEPFSNLHIYDSNGNAVCFHAKAGRSLTLLLPHPGTFLMACTVGRQIETCKISVSQPSFASDDSLLMCLRS